MSDSATASAKYVFLDVVGFSRNRSVEAQADIIVALNGLVLAAVSALSLTEEHLLLLPTGDGICIGILNVDEPFDVHVTLALDILRRLEEYNRETRGARRQFALRLGVNANVDNLVTDVRGNRNIAGAGINNAQRIMSAADGNQILVGQSAFDVLSHREKYDGKFRPLTAQAKHGVRLPVYQLIGPGFPGLNTDLPIAFRPTPKGPPALTPTAAHFMAAALHHEAFLRSRIGQGQNQYSGVVMLYFAALDGLEQAAAEDPRLASRRLVLHQDATPSEQFLYYNKLPFWLVCQLANFVESSVLSPFYALFVPHEMGYWFVNEVGKQKLQEEFPQLLAVRPPADGT